MKYTDYLIVNEVEAGNCIGKDLRDGNGEILWEEVKATACELLKAGVGSLVVIHFPEGGVAASSGGEVQTCGSFSPDRSKIVSTVGAGDAFCAGALYAIHEGYGLSDILAFANTSARFNLFSATSTGGAPTLETIKEFMNSKK